MSTRETVVKQLIEVARSQVGTARAPVNKVKYNNSYYGHPVSGEEFKWCVVFIWWCMQKCHVPMSIFPKNSNVFATRDWYKARDRFFGPTTMPKMGDLVIYKFSHIGLVAQLLPDDQLLTIEGNWDDAVRKVIRRLDDSDIEGYCRPAYHLMEADMTKDELLDALESPRGMEILRRVITTQPDLDLVKPGSVYSKLTDVQNDVDAIREGS
jgi:CHAP domain-containing protein